MTLGRKRLGYQAALEGIFAVFIGVLGGCGLARRGARAGGFRPWFPAAHGGGMLAAAGIGPAGAAWGLGGGGVFLRHKEEYKINRT